jgi:ribosomal protein L34
MSLFYPMWTKSDRLLGRTWFSASGSTTDPSGDGTALRMTKLQGAGIGGQGLGVVLSNAKDLVFGLRMTGKCGFSVLRARRFHGKRRGAVYFLLPDFSRSTLAGKYLHSIM